MQTRINRDPLFEMIHEKLENASFVEIGTFIFTIYQPDYLFA